MMWRDTEVNECRKMEWRWVANVRLPVVAWVAAIKSSHQLVAEHLRNNRCACDRIDADISFDYRLVRPDQGFELARRRAVNEREVNAEVIPTLKCCDGP